MRPTYWILGLATLSIVIGLFMSRDPERAERLNQMYRDAALTGETRQMVVRERLEFSIEDRSSAASGTRYYVSDPTIATIGADGLLTALRAGHVTVTMVNGGLSVRSVFVIAAPASNGSVVGAGGGLVEGGGIIVGIPEGALDGNTTITVRTAGQNVFAAYATLAVAWVMRNPAVTAPLLGARTLEQLEPALAASSVTLSDELYAKVSALTPEPPPATDRNEEGRTQGPGFKR